MYFKMAFLFLIMICLFDIEANAKNPRDRTYEILRPTETKDYDDLTSTLNPKGGPISNDELSAMRFNTTCDEAVREFNESYGSLSIGMYGNKFLAKASREKVKDFYLKAHTYDDTCLVKSDSLLDNHKTLTNIVGVLLDNDAPFCGAFRIANDILVC